MPRGYAPSGARPATSRSGGSVPGPGDSLGDTLLRVRTATQNNDEFTAQHMAAYAAFAGITDRTVARTLHRNNVTWDDVNSYSGITGVNATDYPTFIDLKKAGLTLDDNTAWTRMENYFGVPVNAKARRAYADNSIRPAMVEPYFEADVQAAYPRGHWDPGFIIAMIRNGISPQVALDWRDEGITTATAVTYLTEHKITRDHVRAWSTSTSNDVPNPAADTVASQRRADNLIECATRLKASLGNSPLLLLAVAIGATPDLAAPWAGIDIPAERAARYMVAGLSATEWRANPTTRDMDDNTLAVMCALTQHPGLPFLNSLPNR